MAAELALTRPDPTMNEDALRVMMAAAQRYVASGLLPAEVNTPQKALVVMTAGREMGVPATYALRNIHVVKGKPVCSAELLLALVRRTYGPSAIRVAKTGNTACTVQYREQGWDGVSEYTFTIEDAKQAGVTNNPTWKAYPAAMLRARTISAVVRFAFPECIAGLYTPEELGASVTVDADGEVRIVDGEVVTPLPADPPDLCDGQKFLARWHMAVRGTRFADDDTRHRFVAWYTDNEYDSLTAFLERSTHDEASALIVAVQDRIERETRKARLQLEQHLVDAVARGNAAGGDYGLPDDLSALADSDIQASIDAIERVLTDMAVPA